MLVNEHEHGYEIQIENNHFTNRRGKAVQRIKAMNRSFCMYCLVLAFSLFLAGSAVAEIKIGILAKRGAAKTMQKWSATGDYLSSTLGEKVVIIEPFLNVASSPNDQWLIGRDGEITCLGMRDQICEKGMVHVGTLKGEKTSPDVLNYITETSKKIVNNMAEFGYRGVVGIDYIVSDEGIFPIENNARFNGSSYVSIIVDNIEKLTSSIPYWKFIKIKTASCSFLDLTERIKSVLYDGNKLNSVFRR